MGPLRVNLSTRGIGVSGGVRGARVGVGPRGTYVTLGRGGFQYRRKLNHSPPPWPEPHAASAAPPRTALPPTVDSPGFIQTASVEDLALTTPDASLHELQQRLRATRFFGWYASSAFIVILVMFLVSTIGALVVLVAAVVAGFKVFEWDEERRAARLIYDVDDPQILERAELANAVGQWLHHSQRLWHIYYAVATTDWKKNAGATGLIQRTPIRAQVGSLPHVELNIEPWSVPVGPQKLLFLPDRLLVWDGSNLAGLPYEEILATAENNNFIEEEGVPTDARQVSTTWRFVKKDGGPDLRFSNNAQLPVLEYGKLHLESGSGLRIVLQTSSTSAAAGAAAALQQLARAHAAPRMPTEQPAVSNVVVRSGPAQPSTPRADDRASQTLAVATLLRYITGADRRIVDQEIAFSRAVISSLLPAGHPVIERVTNEFRSLPTDTASVASAVQTIRSQGPDFAGWAMVTLEQLCNADGKTTPKEAEVLVELRQALLN